jgi:hypothetical protein
MKSVEADIKSLGVKRWRIKAQDRKEWLAILREANAKLMLMGYHQLLITKPVTAQH